MENGILWERYKHDVDTHRGYLDLALKLNVFYYAITGAIISFYFLHIDDHSLVKYSLLLPILMSLGIGFFLWKGANASKISHQDLANIAQKLEFQTFSVVAAVLELLLRIFSILLFLTSAGLLFLLFKDSILVSSGILKSCLFS